MDTEYEWHLKGLIVTGSHLNLLIDEAIAFMVVIAIVSGQDGQMLMLLEPAK